VKLRYAFIFKIMVLVQKGPLFNFMTIVGVMLERSEAQGGGNPDFLTFLYFGQLYKSKSKVIAFYYLGNKANILRVRT
jgi:hypothetical protein